MKPLLTLTALLGLFITAAAGHAQPSLPATSRFHTLGDIHPHVAREQSGYVFRNRHLVAVARATTDGIGEITFYPASRPAQVNSLPVAVSPFLLEIGTGERPTRFSPSSVRIAGDDRLELRGTVSEGGATWEAEADLWIGPEAWLSWEVRLRSAVPATLTRLTAMPLRAGREGPREALFPGLAHLEWDGLGLFPAAEQSAGPLTPDPYHVTVPAMALWQDRTTVALLWKNEPGQEGGYPAPSFDARGEEEMDALRMQLSIPSGAGVNAKGQPVGSGAISVPAKRTVRLAGKTVIAPDTRSSTEAVRQWAEAYGTPIIKGFPRSFDAERRLSRPALSGGAVDPLRAMLRTIDAGLSHGDRRDGSAAGPSDLRAGGTADPMIAYRAGGVLEAAAAERDRVTELIRSQLGSGGWPFDPAQSASVGPDELPLDTVGRIVTMALPILRYGAITGDTEAIGAGTRALEYIRNSFRAPRGGGPDRRAPSLAVATSAAECFLIGHKISGEPRYLDDARYWADWGLPFIYFWGDERHPAMQHASVPLLFPGQAGRAAQTVGLEYARVLRDLAEVRPEGFQDFVSEGILASAMRQQAATGPDAGTLSERWNVAENVAEGARVAPDRLLETMYRLMDLRTHVSHIRARVGPDPHFVASGATILQGDTTAMRLRLKLRWLRDRETYTTVSDVPARPLSVEYNTSSLRSRGIPVKRSFLEEEDDLSGPGWWYDPESQLLMLRLRHTGGEDHVEIRWPDPRERLPVERVDTKIRPRR